MQENVPPAGLTCCRRHLENVRPHRLKGTDDGGGFGSRVTHPWTRACTGAEVIPHWSLSPLQTDVPVLPPVCVPRVLNQPVLLPVVNTVPDNENRVVRLLVCNSCLRSLPCTATRSESSRPRQSKPVRTSQPPQPSPLPFCSRCSIRSPSLQLGSPRGKQARSRFPKTYGYDSSVSAPLSAVHWIAW